jgi:ABC-2 type transport system permease protein
MRKYAKVFNLSWQGEFTYRLSFVLWRVRNVLRFLMTFFLWKGIFVTNQNVFGYSQPELLTYVFLVLVVQSIVLSAPSADKIGAEISSGDISNYLVKPVSYLKYWFTRDLSSKFLNLSFALVEVGLLWILLRPNIQLPPSLISWIGFVLICGMAVLIYFFVNVVTKLISFWTPENTWGMTFLTLVMIEILGGSIFPLDVLPHWAQNLLQLTPFPYLIYYPIAIWVGKVTGLVLLEVLLQTLIWVLVMFLFTKFIWHRGLIAYQSEGK